MGLNMDGQSGCYRVQTLRRQEAAQAVVLSEVGPFRPTAVDRNLPPRIGLAFTRVRTERMMPPVETGNLYPL